MKDDIRIIDAYENNLKHINVTIPKGRLVVFAGVSGSGKSSLAFDTIAAESSREWQSSYPLFLRNKKPHYDRPKVGEKYAEHAVEERGWVEKCTDRLLDLGVDVKLEAKKEVPVYQDPVEWIKYDLGVSKAGLSWLHEITEEAREDYTTFDILKEYYQDEEEDVYWAEAQLEIIDCIGKQNWLLQQL